MIITIDGPAGAGKSTVARRLAERLGFRFLDTGAMYRAVTWAALKRSANLQNRQELSDIAETLNVQFRDDRVWIDGQDVTAAIRGKKVTLHVSEVADNPLVREHLVSQQREIASVGDFVCEGRDQGTIAFPDADCKFFLTASPAERAKRRLQQLQSNGMDANLDLILNEQQYRDQRDLDRPIGQLRQAEDAVEIVSDGKSLNQVVDEIESFVRSKMKPGKMLPVQSKDKDEKSQR